MDNDYEPRHLSRVRAGSPCFQSPLKQSWWILCILLIFAGCVFEERVPVEMTSISQSQPLGNEKSLNSNIRFDIGSLEITGGKKMPSLYSLDLDYDKASYEPRIHYSAALNGDEGRFSFSLQGTHMRGLRRQRSNNRLRLAFNDSIPLKLSIDTGVGDARLSLGGLKISRLHLASGVGGAKMSIYEPNTVPCERIDLKSGVGRIEAIGLGNLNFRDLEFEGGVGAASLDFTGEWKRDADIRVQVGVGGVDIRMPREIGVRVDAERHFLSGLHLEGFSQRDSFHYSENYDHAKIKVTVRVATGVGGLRISWI